MTKKKWCSEVVIILVILSCTLPSLLCVRHKTQLHVDEVWTYALANSNYRPYLYVWRTGIGDDSVGSRFSDTEETLSDSEGVFFGKWHSGDEFRNYITVQKGEQFNYSSVCYNQSCDVHPPLYYFIIHTICSLFPDSFSVWYAFIPNLIFYVGSLFVLFFIALGLGLDRTKAVLITLFWGLSRAGISDALFLRMYMMLTFLTLLVLYYHIKLFHDQRGKYLVFIFLINLAGFLTQYYYYIFCFFLTAAFCIHFLKEKRIKQLVIYGSSVLGSVGVAVLLFPAVFNQVFRGAYSEESRIRADSFRNITSWIKLVLKDFFGSIPDNCRIFLTALIFVAVIVGVVFLFPRLKNYTERIKRIRFNPSAFFAGRNALYWMVLLVLVFNSCLLGLVAPIMPLYQDRYYFSIMPLFAIFIVDFLDTMVLRIRIRRLGEKWKLPLVLLLLVVFTINSNLCSRNNYIDYDRNNTSLTDTLDGETCFLVLQQDLRVHVYPIYLQNADLVYVSHDVNEALISEINNFSGDKAYILVQFAKTHPQTVHSLLEDINYQSSVLDIDIETTLGYKDNDALLVVDFTKPKTA